MIKKNIINELEETRINELLNSELTLVLGIIDFLVYERKQDSYKGWWGGKVKSKLVRILKDGMISGDGTDFIDVYKEELEKERR